MIHSLVQVINYIGLNNKLDGSGDKLQGLADKNHSSGDNLHGLDEKFHG